MRVIWRMAIAGLASLPMAALPMAIPIDVLPARADRIIIPVTQNQGAAITGEQAQGAGGGGGDTTQTGNLNQTVNQTQIVQVLIPENFQGNVTVQPGGNGGGGRNRRNSRNRDAPQEQEAPRTRDGSRGRNQSNQSGRGNGGSSRHRQQQQEPRPNPAPREIASVARGQDWRSPPINSSANRGTQPRPVPGRQNSQPRGQQRRRTLNPRALLNSRQQSSGGHSAYQLRRSW